jgi:hypothetical protein
VHRGEEDGVMGESGEKGERVGVEIERTAYLAYPYVVSKVIMITASLFKMHHGKN